MTIFEETAIDELVEADKGLPPDLAFVCWREVRELRAMLESVRKERDELRVKRLTGAKKKAEAKR